MRKLVFGLLIIIAVSAFPFFIGVEAVNIPPVTLTASPSMLTLNARADLGMLYVTLPVAEVYADGSYYINENFDANFLLNNLNVGLAIRPKLPLIPLYVRVAADLPLLNFITTQTFSTLDLKLGLGFKLLFFAVEGGMVARFDSSMNIDFGNIFYFAVGGAL
ncbi:hypothetical protein [Thermosipho atlanticus]|uniref:Outer membrane protein beta-barrel domain-containing protein n=1 Tax=Thermosipho atlanticus DSM 15807 TaxID=1123380 RepID=A0A1M5T2E2_9BACT|nr:hypothetical protein [Thermosipho atlanticus]SHH44917.1 hypothetical protein SAMN02745199_1132 [Thermosipho atlanticus DSM 15807]